jgi:hypothetical protein
MSAFWNMLQGDSAAGSFSASAGAATGGAGGGAGTASWAHAGHDAMAKTMPLQGVQAPFIVMRRTM